MKGLKCSTVNCVHNHDCHCDAGIVRITKNGTCKTKEKCEYGILQATESGKHADKFSYQENSDTLIQCDLTKCVYNKDRYCGGERINVCDSLISTKCFSKHVNI